MHKLTVTYPSSGVAERSYHTTHEQATGSVARLAAEQGSKVVFPGAVILKDGFGRLSFVQIEEVPSNDYQS